MRKTRSKEVRSSSCSTMNHSLISARTGTQSNKTIADTANGKNGNYNLDVLQIDNLNAVPPNTRDDSITGERGESRKSRVTKRRLEPHEIPRRDLFSPSPVPIRVAQFLADSVLREGFDDKDDPDNLRFALLTPDDNSYEYQYEGPFYGHLLSDEDDCAPIPRGDLYPLSKKKFPAGEAKIRAFPLSVAASKKRHVNICPRHLDNDRDIDGALILNLPRNRPPDIGIKISSNGKMHRRFVPSKIVKKYARKPCDFIDLNVVVEGILRNEKCLEPVVDRIVDEKEKRGSTFGEDVDVTGRALRETLWMILKINKPAAADAFRYMDLSMDRLQEVFKINERQLDTSMAGEKKYCLPHHFKYDFDTSRKGLLMRAGISEEAALIRLASEKKHVYGLVEGTRSFDQPKAAIVALIDGLPGRYERKTTLSK